MEELFRAQEPLLRASQYGLIRLPRLTKRCGKGKHILANDDPLHPTVTMGTRAKNQAFSPRWAQ